VFPLGTAGASIATGISILATVIYLFVYINKGKGHLTFKGFQFTLRLKEWKALFNFGVPSFIAEISFSLGLLIINKSLLPFGAVAIAAFGLINHISFIFIRLFTAAMISVLPIISFNIGAGLPKRVLETLKFSLVFTFILGVIVSVTGFIFSDSLVSIFSGNVSEEFTRTANNAMALYFILFIAAGPNYILGAYLQSIGKSMMSAVINFLKGFALVVFFVLLLPEYLNLGLDGIWLSRSLTEVGTLFLIALFTLYHRQTYYSHGAILLKNKRQAPVDG
jgi:Na+-driven multidrug efflux pump